MAHTKKPCPGCGEVKRQRPADEICGACRLLIAEATQAREHQRKEQDTEVVLLPWAYYALPYIQHASGHGEPRHGEEIQKAVRALAQLIGKPARFEQRGDTPPLVAGQEGYSYDGENTVRLPKGFRDLMGTLYAAIIAATDYAYEEGCRDGNNLIVRLAKGEVSIDNFNQICADLTPAPPQKATRRRGMKVQAR